MSLFINKLTYSYKNNDFLDKKSSFLPNFIAKLPKSHILEMVVVKSK